jgi:hypothetical protein
MNDETQTQKLAQKIKTARQKKLCEVGLCNLDSLYAVNRQLEKEFKEEMMLIENANDIFSNPNRYIK